MRAPILAPRTKGPKAMLTFSIETSGSLNSVAPKKRSAKSQAPSRHKIASAATAAAKTTQRSVESKAARIAAAKTSVKGDEPKVERVTKREPTLGRPML